MQEVYKLIAELKGRGIVVEQFENNLKLQGPVSELTQQEKETLTKYKKEIIEFLKESGSNEDLSSIPVLAEQECYDLSPSQNRLWTLGQLSEGSTAYNMPSWIPIDRTFDVVLFKKAVLAVIDRHEILRTVFDKDENGTVKQWIKTKEELNFQINDIDYTDFENAQEMAEAYAKEDFFKPFDFANGPLIRVTLIKLSEENYIFYYNMHHIISDGWSTNIIYKDTIAYYNSFKDYLPLQLPELKIQYKDYAVWKLNRLEAGVYDDSKEYWNQIFSGELPVLDLPTNLSRPKVFSYEGRSLSTFISAKDTATLNNYCKENQGSLFMGLLAIWNVLCAKYTNQTDFITGTPVSGRDHIDLKDQIGFYVNSLALRNTVSPDDNFNSVFENLKQNTLAAFTHGEYPLDAILEDLNISRDISRNAIFDAMLVLQNKVEQKPQSGASIGEDRSRKINDNGACASKLDLVLDFEEVNDGLRFQVIYYTGVYQQEMVEQLMNHFKQLIAVLVENCTENIGGLNYLSMSEQTHLLKDFNSNIMQFPENETLVSLFRKNLETNPDATAVVFKDRTYSYREIESLSDGVAARLQNEFNVVKGAVVGIHLDRSEWFIISALAIMKVGAAFVALGIELPENRKQVCIDDAGIKVVITEDAVDFKVAKNFVLDTIFPFEELSSKFVPVSITSNDLAYVIYTSGSTGTPKGVMIEHTGIVNTVLSKVDMFGMEDCKRSLQFASFSFDASICETFVTFASGGSLYVIEEEIRKDAKLVEAYIESNGIDMALLPPPYLQLMDVERLKNLNVLITAGEAPVIEKVSEFLKYGRYCNAYGPTEVSICSSIQQMDKGTELTSNTIPIGVPMPNVEVLILNDYNQLQPVGVVGEICVSGAGLARGYINLPELTKEKFIAHPYTEGERLYKTGDLGKWMSDGSVVFMGRKDEQIKINGHRIELGEITYWLQEKENVQEAVTLDLTDDLGNKELAAYLVTSEEMKPSEVRDYLSNYLPSYMIPSYYVKLDQIPLTTSGKINRKALPNPKEQRLASTKEYVAPTTNLEKKVVAIWKDVLAHEVIGVRDDFFELGGHSLKAVQLTNEYFKHFGVKLNLNDLFTNSKLESHCTLISQLADTTYQEIECVELADNYPLSSSQYRLWILSQLEGGSVAYNMTFATPIYVSNVDNFRQAVDAVIDRHEILRTVFKKNADGEIRQWVKSSSQFEFELTYKDFRELDNSKELVKKYIDDDSYQAFDLVNGPLLRISLLRIQKNEYMFYCNMHHIISDGLSMELLSRDVVAFYDGLEKNEKPKLPELRIQYKDFASWQLQEQESDVYQEHKEYWLKSLSGDLPLLDLPFGNIRPKILGYDGQCVATFISPSITRDFISYCKNNQGTLFMGLLATWNVLFNRYTNQKDFIIGTSISGRDHIDLKDQIGFYINTLALRNKVSPDQNFNSLFTSIKEQTLEDYNHQMYPFDKLVEALALDKDMSRSAVFDVLLTLQNGDDNETESSIAEELCGIYQNKGNMPAQFDLVIDFKEIGGSLYFNVIFNTNIYNSVMIESMMSHYVNLMSALVRSPEQNIGSVDFLAETERKELLLDLNATEVPVSLDTTFVDLFKNQVNASPNNIAVRSAVATISYQELDELSNKMCHYLNDRFHLNKGDCVVINIDRDEWLPISILALFKLGCAYIPVDPSYPEERKQYILDDSNCANVIDSTFISSFLSASKSISNEYSPTAVLPTDLAYIIYTSGSTGNPKGVMIEHQGMMNHLYGMVEELTLNSESVIVQNAPYTFDISVWQLLNALIVGGTTSIYNSSTLMDPNLFLQRVSDEEATVLQVVPSYLSALLDVDQSLDRPVLGRLSYLSVTGEAVNKELIERWFNYYPQVAVVNAYGPAEASDDVSLHVLTEVPTGNTVPVGKPIRNMKMYVLDEQLNLCAKGVTGELCVSGMGLAKGYLNRPELTQEKFVPHPFIEGERLYRTGDLGRWSADGTMEFMGRMDSQVKVNGHRIELEEIEYQLQLIDGISEAVVIVYTYESGIKDLVAYLVGNTPLESTDIIEELNGKLPKYMCPMHFVQLESIPLTPNGKVDKNALPDPKSSNLLANLKYTSPQNELEEKMVNIIAKVLEREAVTIGVQDNFFDLGMNSIKLFKVLHAVSLEFEIEMEAASFFEHPTVTSFTQNVLTDLAQEVEEDIVDTNVSEEIDDFLNLINN